MFIYVMVFSISSAASVWAQAEIRISGGNEARIQEFPFVAIIQDIKGSLLETCTGGIIAVRWLITAAHCGETDFLIYAGFDNYFNFIDDLHDGKVQYRISEEVHEHPGYAYDIGLEDLTLIKVNAPFRFNEFVSPIKLSTLSFSDLSSRKCKAIGWGKIKSQFSFHLRVLDVEIAHGRKSCKCLRRYLKENLLCLGSNESKSICKGDSGGVLLCQGQAFGIAHGIYKSNKCRLSTFLLRSDSSKQSLICDEPGVSAMYTYICPYLKWIDGVLGTDSRKEQVVPAIVPDNCNDELW